MKRDDDQRKKGTVASREGDDRLAEFWLIENKEAIESANAYVAKHGLPLAQFRPF